jgi:clan AA aspartic protease (TIGR02281 family)
VTVPQFTTREGEEPSQKPYRRPLLIAATIAVLLMSVLVLHYGYSLYADSIVGRGALRNLDPVSTDLVRRLDLEPCNQALAHQLVGNLAERDEYTALLTFSTNRLRRCGEDDQLLPSVFRAQMSLGAFVEAEKTASGLITRYPADPNSFGWRAQVREKQRDFAGAYSDMRRALSLFPDPSKVALQVFYETARLAALSGQQCMAVATLRDYIAYEGRLRYTQQLSTLMQGWRHEGNCPPLSGVGTATLRYKTNAGAIIIPVEVNGVRTRMLVDTGATRTLISTALAKRAGIGNSGLRDLVHTANGDAIVMTGVAESVSVGGASLANVPVYIQGAYSPALGDSIDGLLGLSFLGNFQLHIGNGLLQLKPVIQQ